MSSPLPPGRYLIVNADDFGFSPGVNRGILHAHERGVVTSTSVMVRWPAAADAAAATRDHPRLSLGLHVDLGEWSCRSGVWVADYVVLSDADAASPAAVEREVARQVDAFRRLTGRDPTHLDSHQHAHRSEPLRSVLTEAAGRLGVPLRHYDPRVRYCGDFYGQARNGEPYPQGITPQALCRVLTSLPQGVTELCCHPGAGVDHGSQYAAEREVELAALGHPDAFAAVAASGLKLLSFADLTQ